MIAYAFIQIETIMKLAIVTDSTAYLNERIRNHKDLFIIPIPVIIDVAYAFIQIGGTICHDR
jgi:hypothetical protein